MRLEALVEETECASSRNDRVAVVFKLSIELDTFSHFWIKTSVWFHSFAIAGHNLRFHDVNIRKMIRCSYTTQKAFDEVDFLHNIKRLKVG